MITREEIREGFKSCEEKNQKIAFLKFHMDQEKETPELYENLVNNEGNKLFNFKGLYESWSSDNPQDYLCMKYYGMTWREYTMRYITKTSSKNKSTKQMIEDATVEVPDVPEDDVSKVIGEMDNG